MRTPGGLFIKLAIIIASVFCFTIGGLVLYGTCEKRNYDGCYEYKLQLLKEAKDVNKAVFIGGSATNFGVHAELFEQETGIKAINMGFSAGRSFDAYLESVKPYIKDGDYLFMCPEPGYWNGNFHNIDSETMMFYEYQNSSALRVLNAGDAYNVAKYTITNGWTGWYNSISQFFKEMLIDVFHVKEYSIYDRWSCNTNGDYTYHKDKEPSEFTAGKISSKLQSYSFCDDLKKYIDDWKKEVNFTPYILFAPIDEAATQGDTGFNQQAIEIANRTGIKTLFSQSDSAYPHSYFFDTMYHLKWDTAEEYYTRLVINSFNAHRS